MTLDNPRILPARFWRNVEIAQPGGCWLWRGTISDQGYGKFGGRYAHVLTWEELHGPLPAGLERDHLCRTRNCVNPLHLEAVTHRENLRRAFPTPQHGSRWTYKNHGCRCDECRAANTEWHREHRARTGRTPGGRLAA